MEESREVLWNEVINLEIMRQWCSISNSGLGLIIPNYNIVDHLKFCGISKPHLQRVLGVRGIQRNNKRLLIFNASWKVLVTIRVASEIQLKEEINHCIIDINMLLLMFRGELEGSGVAVTGLVVYSGNNIHSESNCANCQHFIVTREVFESSESINNFWREHKEENLFDKIIRLPESTKEKVFMAVSSKIIPYLASYQYQVCNTQFLPTLNKDATESIEEAMLLLDRSQMEIAYSMENRIILKGDYGTGKTIICLKKIEILSTVLGDSETIYYINFQGRSELDGVVSKKVKGFHPNAKVLKGDSTLSNIIESKILPREEKAGTRMVHLFVDEYRTETLTKKEVSTLVNLFSEKEILKKSTIFLSIQPIEITRKDFHYFNGKESEYCENGNMLYELEKIMTVKHLQHVMRTTVEINLLIGVTQDYLHEKSNHYTRIVESSKSLLVDEVSQNENLYIHKNLLEDKFVTIHLNSEADIHENATIYPNNETNIHKDEVLTRDSKGQNAFKYNFENDFKEFQYERTADFDEIHKLTSTETTDTGDNCQKRVTTYRYYCESRIGHNISGPRPSVINLACFNESEVVEIFALLFHLIESKTKRTVIIHFEHDNPRWLTNLFKLSTIFPSLAIAYDVEHFLSNSNKRMVLVKNYNCVRGIEFSDVILLLDANEYHLKQFIPEAMARCQSSLSIVIKPAEKGRNRGDGVMDLVKH